MHKPYALLLGINDFGFAYTVFPNVYGQCLNIPLLG